MIQDPEYVKKVHKALTDKVGGFNKSLEEFTASLSDEKYVSNVYKALSDKVDGFSKTPEQFKSLVYSQPQKKNSVSTGTAPQKASQSKTPTVQPTSVGGKQPQVKPSVTSTGKENLIDKFGFKNKEEQKKAGAVASKVKVDVTTPKSIKTTPSKEVVYKTDKQKSIEKEASIAKQKIKREEEKQFVQDFRNATILPDNYENQIRQEVQDELQGKGVWNTITQGASNVWNKILPYIPGAPSSEKELEQLKSDVTFLPKAKEEYKNILLKQGVKENEITDEILTKGAIDLEVNKRIEDKKLSLANDYLDNLPNEIKDRMEFNTLNQKELKTPEVKRQYDILIALDNDLKEDNQELIDLEKKAKEFNGLTQEESNRYNSLISSIKGKIDSRNKLYKTYEKNVGELTTLEEEYDLFKRSYGFEDKAGKILNAVADLGLGVLQLANMAKPGPTQDLISLQIAGLKNEKDKAVAEKFQKQVEDSKNINDILDYAGDVITSQSANIAMGYLTGGTSTLVAIGGSSAGNKYSELIQSNLEGKTDYSKLQMYLASGLYGAAESLESNTLKMIGGSKKLIGKALKNEQTKNVFKESLSKKTFDAGKSFLKNYKGELGEELTTFGSQKLTDIVVLDMDSKDVFKNAKEEVKSIVKDTGVMVVGLNLFPATTVKILNAFTPKDYTYNLDSNNKQIEELSKIINNKDASDLVKKEAKDKIDVLVKSNEEALNKVVKNTSQLSNDLIDRVVEIEIENSNLRNKANEINNDNTISKEQKASLLSGLKEKFISNESLREDIVSGRKKSFDILPEEESTKLKLEAAEELKAEAIANGIKEEDINIKEEEITKRATANYEKQPKETTAEKPTEEGPTGQENVQDATATQGQPNQVVQEEKDKVEELRQQEIAELREQVENPEEFITDGKVDATKISESDNAKAKEIYAKYDKLLKPLLTNIKTQEDAIQEQSTSEGVLRPEQSEMGLQEVVQRDQEPEVTTEEVKSEEEVTKIKSELEASKERLNKAFNQYRNVNIAFDPKNQLAKDKELVKALLDYAYNNIRLGKYNAVKLIEDLAKDGIEITRDGAKYIFDRASKRVQRDINKTVGVKPKPTEQKRINKAYSIGIADQKLENKKKKEKDKEVKEVKSETSKLNKDRKSAIKNVKVGKTGFINRNSPTFRLVSLNPKILKLALIPEMFEKYKSQINVLSKRRLSLDLSELGGLEEFSKFVNEVENNYIDTSEKILSVQNQIDAFEELNPTAKREAFKPSEDLKDLYNENKGLFTFNNVDSETTAEENEELSNNKEEVINNIDAVRKIAIDSDYSPTSKSFEILSLFADLKQSDLDMLNRNQVIGLNNAINAIVDGFEIPTYANDIFTAIMANRNKYGLSKDVERSYKKTGLASSKIFKAIDGLFKKFRQDEKTKAYKTNLTSIDAAFKIYGGIPKVADIVAENFKGIPILRYIMGAIQKQQGRVSARVEEMMSNLDKVREKLIEKSKDYEESLMKIHFAFLSAQNNSNPDNKTIQTAKDSFLANSKSSSYIESERKKYAEFVKKYGDYVITYDNGELKVVDGNGNEVKDFFTKEEIDSYNAIRKELDIQAEAAYESQFYHGKNASPLVSNYFPQNNYSTVYGNEELKSIQNAFNNPTLKSSNVKSRVVKQQAHAVGHNPFSIAISAVKSVEMQHKLLTDVNIAKRALSDLIKENEGNEDLKFLYENILGVVNKFVEQTQNATRIEDDSIGNDVSRALETIFFRSTLASVDRTVKDLTANYTGLILSDGEKLLSSKLTNDLKDIPKEKVSDVLKNFLINSGASQPTRLMNNDFDVKTSRIDFQTEGASSLLTNRGFSSKFKTFIDSVTRKTKLNVPRDFFKRMNEQLQSFSDNAPALSLWAGSFYKEFEALSGTSVDIQKIASGDKAYLLKYKNEIEIASLIANYTLSSRLGSKNIAEGVQKIIDLSRNQGGNNVFEKYMNYLFSRFRIISARDTRTAINNLVQNGFGNENGAQERIIVGNALRSIVYTALAGVIPLKFASLLMGGDDDEEKIKDSLDDMSSDPDFMKGIVETYSKYEEKAKKLEDSDEYMKSILELYRSRRSELMNLLKDDRFREAVEARYRFFAREHFNKIINGHSANVDAMKKLDGNISYINNIIKMIDDKDDPVNYTKYVDLLSYINSEYGYMKYSPKERKDILDKAISRMEDDGFYTFREKNGGLNEKGEYDITTSEGKFKVANLFQTIDMLKNYRENSIEGRALKGGLEFAINTAAGSRGNIKVRAISTLVEVLNKYQREERYGFYDSSKDRVTNGFGRTMLNGETAFNGKFKVEEDDVTGKSLGLSKEISDVVNMTVPELAMISKMASEPKYSDIGMLLGLPTSTDLSKILREVEKDEVYQSSRGKVFYDASEKNKVFNKKDTLYKFPIKMDVEKSKIIKK
jgi:hypothetical protein